MAAPFLVHQGWLGHTMPEPGDPPYNPSSDYVPQWGIAYKRGSGFPSGGLYGMPEPQAGIPYNPGVSYTPEYGILSRRYLRWEQPGSLLRQGPALRALSGEAAAEGVSIVEDLRQQGVAWLSQAMKQLMDLGASYGEILRKIEAAQDERAGEPWFSANRLYLETKAADIQKQRESIRELWDWLYEIRVYLFGDDYGVARQITQQGQAAHAVMTSQAVVAPLAIVVGKAVVVLAGIGAVLVAWTYWVKDKNDTLVELCKIHPAVCPSAASGVGAGDVLGIGATVKAGVNLVMLGAVVLGGFLLWKQFAEKG